MNTTERGIIMSLVLDAVDPRLTDDERHEATSVAIDMDAVLPAALWSSMTFAIVDTVRRQHGDLTSDELMRQLGLLMLAAVESPELDG